MNAQQYLDHLISEGKISFTKSQLSHDLRSSTDAAASLIKRLKQKGQIASPAKGYYLIITPEFRSLGCLPPDFFIDDLMKYLKINYYVALLSAALYQGAAHQQPQVFQVMVPVTRTDIHCGRVRIQFIKNQSVSDNPSIQLKTRTGFMNVSTPESTAKDLLNFIGQSGGIGQIATVIDELADVLNPEKLQALVKQQKQNQWVQRLGYILETLGHETLAESLFEVIKEQKLRIIPLMPHREMTGASRNKKWRLAINANVESDLDNDTY